MMQPVLPLLARIHAGETAPVDAWSSYAAVIERRENEIRAFAHLALEPARAGAATAPLGGLPIGVKDIFDVAGMPTGCGSSIYAGREAKVSAPVVVGTETAGGIVIGKTVTTEFAFSTPAATRNPHNLEHTPGGSSSGSAAAVAAGMVPFAFGTQTAGSVIRPAAFCGVAGFKPSFGDFPPIGVKAFAWSLDTIGYFAPTVADVAYFHAAVTGRPLEPVSAPRRPRIALVDDYRAAEAGADAHAALAEAARRAADAGAEVGRVSLPGALAAAHDTQMRIMACEAPIALAGEYALHRESLSPGLRALLDEGAALPRSVHRESLAQAGVYRHSFDEFIRSFDAVLTLSAPGAAPHGLATTGMPTFNRIWTLLGVPCVNVPGLADAAGMPLGVQVVGSFGTDEATLAVAAWLERALGG